ncbi:MAG: glutamine--fructose-6-phosphate transaminase (isomerizing) [Chloroflexota bacterium]
MCGIVGYTGYRPVQPVLLNSLKRLEYRGYDSCGIAVLDHGIKVYKAVGRVENLSQVVPETAATIGIGHTRWATHGAVTTANAHPHLDCTGKIAVVHNGVIENFQTLREQLVRRGHVFRSETDTEVIAHLIEESYRGSLKGAVAKALAEVTGSFAIVVLSSRSRVLVAARKESPLVIGVGDHENFVASDVAAVLDYTDRAIYLEDGDLCTILGDDINISNRGKKASRTVCSVPWTVEQVQQGGYEHFMLKEIHEQPRAVADTLTGHTSVVEPHVTLGIERPEGARQVILTACGSSYHAALVGEYLLSRSCHIPSRAVIASEFEQVEAVLDRDWVIAITQSGETADTLRALKKAKAAGCSTLAVVNVLGSTATRVCDQSFFVRAGPEVSVAATKTFTAQLTAMYLLMLFHSTLDPETRAGLIEELKLLPARVGAILEQETLIAEQGTHLARYDNIFYVARGINCAIAMEGALKLKEVSYIHAEAYPAGELKHGSFALLGPGMPVVVLAPRDETYSMVQTSIKEVKARGSPVIAIADEDDTEVEQLADVVLRVPAANPLFSPVLNTIVVQLLAYYAAKARSCPIDRPVNLAKSVTVL